MAAHHHARAGIALLVATLALPASAAAASLQRTHGPDPRPHGATASVAALPVPAQASWCGNGGTDGARHQVDNGPYRYRAVYAHAADVPSRLKLLGAQLQADAFAASALIERQYSRAIRYDIGTPCGRGQLDIVEVRLPFTQAQLGALAAAGGTTTFDAIVQALRRGGLPVAAGDESAETLAALTENFLVWLDAPGPQGACGQGTALLDAKRSESNLNNLGGKLALVFRSGSGFCGADVVRHEIGHNLGALQPDAPHTADGVHCTDARQDTMCQPDSPVVAGARGARYFDYGNDDYWDPPAGPALPWWTLNLSRFLCTDRDCNRPDGAAAGQAAPTAAQKARARRAARRAERQRYRQARPRVARRVVRRGAGQTRLRLRLRGHGSARLTIACRRSRQKLMRRRVTVPVRVRFKTNCRSLRVRLSHRRVRIAPAARQAPTPQR